MDKLCRGCVVKMKPSSNMTGHGNHQCVSDYIEPLGEVYFFGHNTGYKDYDIAEILEYPITCDKSLCDKCKTKINCSGCANFSSYCHKCTNSG